MEIMGEFSNLSIYPEELDKMKTIKIWTLKKENNDDVVIDRLILTIGKKGQIKIKP